MSKKGGKNGGKAPPRLDATNLAGITMLMNPQHIKIGTDLEKAEKKVMGKNGSSRPAEADHVRSYTAELNQLAEDLGIDLIDENISTKKSKSGGDVGSSKNISSLIDKFSSDGSSVASGSSYSGSDSGSDDGSDSGSDDGSGSESGSYSDSGSESGSGSGSYSDSGSGSYSGSDSGSDRSSSRSDRRKDKKNKTDDADLIISRLESNLGLNSSSKNEHRSRSHKSHDYSSYDKKKDGAPQFTDEQERRRHINSVVKDIRGETRTTFGVERERLQDLKASKLEQIGQLRMTLEDEGIDCGSVGNPKSDSPIEEVDSVLNILRLKNDRNRYSSLAEEVILGVAEGIETVFDGTRKIPIVDWTPDYTGYHNTVNIKLHRMRFETSQVVGNIIEKFNIGSTSRILMELLPSFFLYPRAQKKQRGSPGLSSDPRVADARMAYASIRDSDERKTLHDI